MKTNTEIERIINRELIAQKAFPKDADYLFGGSSFTLLNNGYKQRDEPLFMFKKNSPFRLWCEKMLKKYDLEKDFTLLYCHSDEWYDNITIINKKNYKEVSL